MTADSLIKALLRQKHKHFINQLNIINIISLIEG